MRNRGVKNSPDTRGRVVGTAQWAFRCINAASLETTVQPAIVHLRAPFPERLADERSLERRKRLTRIYQATVTWTERGGRKPCRDFEANGPKVPRADRSSWPRACVKKSLPFFASNQQLRRIIYRQMRLKG